MDKETLSNYGWVTIVTLVLAIMIALATPFGNYVGKAVKVTAEGLGNVTIRALDTIGIKTQSNLSITSTKYGKNCYVSKDYIYTRFSNNGYVVVDNEEQAKKVFEDAGAPSRGMTFEDFLNQIGATKEEFWTEYENAIKSGEISAFEFFCNCGIFIGNVVENEEQAKRFLENKGIPQMGMTFEDFLNQIGATKEEFWAEYENVIKNGDTTVADLFAELGIIIDSATDSAMENGFYVSIRDKEETSYEPLAKTINGMPVISLYSTFGNCQSIETSPAIPNTVTDMTYTFDSCTSLTTAPIIPNNVTNMESTFVNCTKLSTVSTIPDGVEHMSCTFYGCASLTGEIEINANPTDYERCFADTVQPIILTGSSTMLNELAATATNGNVTVKQDGSNPTKPEPDSTIFIPNGAKYTKADGTTLEGNGKNKFPDVPAKGDTYEQGDYIYTYYKSLNYGTEWSVKAKENKTSYGEILSEIAGKPVTNMRETFQNTNIEISPEIPNTVTDISYAFYSCRSLKEAPTIPSNVINMDSTFAYTNIKVAPIIPNGVINLTGTFMGTDITTAPTIPNSVTNMYGTFTGCSSLTKVHSIPASVMVIELAFKNCTSLKIPPALPNNVKSLYQTFYGCTSLTTAPVIPNKVKNMKETFYNCTSLTTTPEIPSSVRKLESTFGNCKSLTKISKISNGITDMNHTFDSCTSLTSPPTLPASLTSLTYTFVNCTSLANIPQIPQSVTLLSGTFSGCTSLVSVSPLPNNIIHMTRTFENCTSLTTAPIIPDSVTDLNWTFRGCTSLTTAPTIPSSVTSLYNTFSGCTSLKTAPTIPNSVTNMSLTFDGCTSLTTASTIPNSVTDMYSTFRNCTSLTGTITINANPTSYYYCFYNTSKSIVLTGSSKLLKELSNTNRYRNINVK